MLAVGEVADSPAVSNTLASGSAQTPPPSGDTGQDPPGGDAPLPDGGAPPPDGGAGGDAGADGADGGTDADGNRRPAAERIGDVIAQRNAALDYGRYWYDVAMRGQQPPGAAATPAPGAAPSPPAPTATTKPPPKLTDFPNGDGTFDAIKWSDAHATWADAELNARVAATVDSRLSTRDQQTEQVTVQTTWQGRVDQFRAANPDFDAVTNNPTLPITKEMSAAIMRSDVGPAVYLHLGKNPHEAARISRQTPDQQRISIARLEGRFEATGAAPSGGGGGRAAPRGGNPPPPARTQAPPPPAGTQRGGKSDARLEDLPLDEYVTRRMEERAGKRR